MLQQGIVFVFYFIAFIVLGGTLVKIIEFYNNPDPKFLNGDKRLREILSNAKKFKTRNMLK